MENEVAASVGTGLIAGLAILWIVLILVGLGFLIWWILMLIDCAKREFPEKGTWLPILIISLFIGLSWLATIIYYFAVYRKYKKSV